MQSAPPGEAIPPPIDKKLQAKLGNVKDTSASVLAGRKGEKLKIDQSTLKSEATLYIGNCEDCEYEVNTQCTKILMESCTKTRLILNGSVLTNIVEIWKCKDCSSQVNTRVSTVQVDLCHGLDLQFAKREHYHSLVWAGVHDLSLSFADSPAHRLQSGFAQMKAQHADLQEHTDQFIVRFVGDQLLQELIVRLPNGYPTTEREASAFDANQKKREEFMRKKAEEMLKLVPKKYLADPKVGRNEPCPCKSGHKYKKCCGVPKPGDKKEQSAPAAPADAAAAPAAVPVAPAAATGPAAATAPAPERKP